MSGGDDGKVLTVSRKLTKILTVSRKSHYPIETLIKQMRFRFMKRNELHMKRYLQIQKWSVNRQTWVNMSQ